MHTMRLLVLTVQMFFALDRELAPVKHTQEGGVWCWRQRERRRHACALGEAASVRLPALTRTRSIHPGLLGGWGAEGKSEAYTRNLDTMRRATLTPCLSALALCLSAVADNRVLRLRYVC
jgi:hypothetical protein